MEQTWLDSIDGWEKSSVFFVYKFGTAIYSDAIRWVRGEGPEAYRTGDLAAAIERCITTPFKQLQQYPDAMKALGDPKFEE